MIPALALLAYAPDLANDNRPACPVLPMLPPRALYRDCRPGEPGYIAKPRATSSGLSAGAKARPAKVRGKAKGRRKASPANVGQKAGAR